MERNQEKTQNPNKSGQGSTIDVAEAQKSKISINLEAGHKPKLREHIETLSHPAFSGFLSVAAMLGYAWKMARPQAVCTTTKIIDALTISAGVLASTTAIAHALVDGSTAVCRDPTMTENIVSFFINHADQTILLGLMGFVHVDGVSKGLEAQRFKELSLRDLRYGIDSLHLKH